MLLLALTLNMFAAETFAEKNFEKGQTQIYPPCFTIPNSKKKTKTLRILLFKLMWVYQMVNSCIEHFSLVCHVQSGGYPRCEDLHPCRSIKPPLGKPDHTGKLLLDFRCNSGQMTFLRHQGSRQKNHIEVSSTNLEHEPSLSLSCP